MSALPCQGEVSHRSMHDRSTKDRAPMMDRKVGDTLHCCCFVWTERNLLTSPLSLRMSTLLTRKTTFLPHWRIYLRKRTSLSVNGRSADSTVVQTSVSAAIHRGGKTCVSLQRCDEWSDCTPKDESCKHFAKHDAELANSTSSIQRCSNSAISVSELGTSIC